jgi:TadE-like protein
VTLAMAKRRGGATSVEFAVVSFLLFLLLFGIFEYARFLFVQHVTANAARDAARFAAVRTGGGTMPGEPAAVTADDVKEVARSGLFNGQPYGTGMCGMESQLTGFTVDVFAVPDADLYASPPNLDPAGKPAWNAAAFQQKIAVRVSGTYNPVLPGLLGLGTDVPVRVTVLVSSEAN